MLVPAKRDFGSFFFEFSFRFHVGDAPLTGFGRFFFDFFWLFHLGDAPLTGFRGCFLVVFSLFHVGDAPFTGCRYPMVPPSLFMASITCEVMAAAAMCPRSERTSAIVQLSS
jgi:hypothetical protein